MPDRLFLVPKKFRVPLPTTIKKRDTQLYNISGLVFQPEHAITSFVFSGYFRYDPNTNLLFDGELIDLYGTSVIKGRMKKNYLSFEKRYNHRQSTIDYHFQKENGIWKGTFRGPFVVARGESKCITKLMLEDASQVFSGSLNL